MILQPLVAFLLGNRPKVRRNRDCLVLSEFKVRHSGTGTEPMRILNPPHHPARINFRADAPEAWTDFGNVLISLDEMTTSAADLLEEALTLGKKRRIFKWLNVQVA